ncbi:helix-turn-helix domain-containing protein [Arthrobacter sp. STN4]|uniref:helix-turn-helix domain-containing protein n=1 Tax=Arthrobacter sp. STN4 TaxID=2923276 RepID=UPI00211A8CB1|nr:helix-turn-helix domain-containing protein [Arthrobacter sp. STN4]MCQ9162952.1 helix-turn-helix domain-containing protein [Arthrobacter sp. STN4]
MNSTPSPDIDPQAQKTLAISRVAAAALRERLAKEELAAAENLMEIEIDTSRRLGVSWAMLAELTGLTEPQVRWRLHRYDPSVRANRLKALVPESEKKDRTGPRPGQGPGMSVTEYARTVGVSRKTVYAWIDEGRIQAAQNEIGITRVLSTRDPRNS